MTTTAEKAGEKSSTGIANLIEVYRPMLSEALPRHVAGDQWVRRASAAIKRNPDLQRAAENNPAACLRVLMDAARLGHEPGTKEYYLIPRGNKELGTEPNPRNPRKTRLRQEITGMEGYQGVIERFYRAGAVSSVIVEVVRAGDTFRFSPGLDERPVHEVNWFGERGEPVGVYAYAMMQGGGTSKVVVLSKAEVYEFRDRSESYKYNSGPWISDELSMWKKTAARRLEPWVPTSSEYLKEQIRAMAEVAREQQAVVEETPAPGSMPDDPHQGDVVDGEIVAPHDEDGDEPDAE